MHRIRRSPRLPFVLAFAVASLGIAPAGAQSAEPAVEVGLSYYQPSFDTTVRLDSAELGTGTDLSLEDDLGVEKDASELRGEVLIRMGSRFHLALDHVEFERSGSNVLGRTVQFGDVVYAANANLTAAVDSSHTGAALRYSLLRNQTTDFAVSLGVTHLDVAASISGRAVATAGGVPISSVDIEEKGDASGPVPLVGLHGLFWLGDRLRLRLDGRYIDIGELVDEDKWSGSMTEYGASVDYFVLPWLGLGVGYAGTAIDVDFDDGDELGSVDYDFDGVRGTVTLLF
jgi:hypothetical protein